jgi:hypothetical protein
MGDTVGIDGCRTFVFLLWKFIPTARKTRSFSSASKSSQSSEKMARSSNTSLVKTPCRPNLAI